MLRGFAFRKLLQNLESIDDSAGFEVDCPKVIPFLELPDKVFAWKPTTSGYSVNVDRCPFEPSARMFLDNVGHRGAIIAEATEKWRLCIFVL